MDKLWKVRPTAWMHPLLHTSHCLQAGAEFKISPQNSTDAASSAWFTQLLRCSLRPWLKRSKVPLSDTPSDWCNAGCPECAPPWMKTQAIPPAQTWHLWLLSSGPLSGPKQTPWNWECWPLTSDPRAEWQSPGRQAHTPKSKYPSNTESYWCVIEMDDDWLWIFLKLHSAALEKADYWCCESCPWAA